MEIKQGLQLSNPREIDQNIRVDPSILNASCKIFLILLPQAIRRFSIHQTLDLVCNFLSCPEYNVSAIKKWTEDGSDWIMFPTSSSTREGKSLNIDSQNSSKLRSQSNSIEKTSEIACQDRFRASPKRSSQVLESLWWD
ncbi:unnamed protein product [Fraxinus pennsylvanica]|uniref:Uncharacterized protein n=1 Tax=Fraxinus pennsylvanica TaxID=56036 RepID=A0AAD2DNQ5_9LAMI|nr:unnamed protein product [Fraxinus pennsylvanica]